MRALAVLACAVALVGCKARLAVPSGTLIACSADADCQSGSVCATSAGFCVSPASLTQGPPDQLSPVKDAVVLGTADGTYAFAWSARAEARQYTLQIATDKNFATIVVEQTSDIPSLQVTLTQPLTYWWRVRSDIDADGFASGYPQSVFDILPKDFIAVGCASPPPVSADPSWNDKVGNLTKPFCSINDGIAAATVYGIADVRVAGLGATEYAGTVALKTGIRLLGGWSTTFATRDIAANVTTISAYLAENVIVADGIRTLDGSPVVPTSIDGFTLLHHSSGANLSEVVVVRVSDSDTSLTISNNIIRAEDQNVVDYPSFPTFGTYSAQNLSIGLAIYAADPQITGNTIYGGSAASDGDAMAVGLYVQGGEPSIINNTITAGAAGSFDTTGGKCISYGLSIDSFAPAEIDGKLLVADNTITAGLATTQYDAYSPKQTCLAGAISAAMFVSSSSDQRIVGNVLVSGAGSDTYGYDSFYDETGAGDAELVDNTIVVTIGESSTTGIFVTGRYVIEDNIIAATATGGTSIAVVSEFADLGSQHARTPAVFVDNALAGFTHVYGTLNGAVEGTYDLGDAETVINDSSGTASGNSDAYATIADLQFAALASFPDPGDYHLTSASDAFLRAGAAVYAPADCSDPTVPDCVAIAKDRAGATRTCPTPGTSCWSIGAYELD